MAAWRNLRNMTYLGMQDNGLTGNLPPELAMAWPRLQILGITSNKIVGAHIKNVAVTCLWLHASPDVWCLCFLSLCPSMSH